MTLLGHGVHITAPQPTEEAIAWHTVPAQLNALRKQLRDAETSRQGVMGEVGRYLDGLDEGQKARLEDERKLTTQRLKAMHEEFEGVQVLQQVADTVLSERLDRLEQPLLKRLWRWLTRKGRKNGPTL